MKIWPLKISKLGIKLIMEAFMEHELTNVLDISSMIYICINHPLRFLVKYCPKTAFQLVFCKLELEHLQVDMGIYHLEMCFKFVRYQMPHCYLCSKSRTNMEKWYFKHFIANSYLSFNKKDLVLNKLKSLKVAKWRKDEWTMKSEEG